MADLKRQFTIKKKENSVLIYFKIVIWVRTFQWMGSQLVWIVNKSNNITLSWAKFFFSE